MAKNKPVTVFASDYLFSVAALYAAIILPWSMLALLGQVPAPVGLMSVYGHAHELLAGYAILVVSGYLLGKLTPLQIGIFLGIWALGRASFLLMPGSVFAMLCAFIMAVSIAWLTIPRFARSAKKWRNQSLVPLLSLLSFVVFLVSVPVWNTHKILLVFILVLSLLMFFMGGRTLAPAVAGHLIKQNIPMPARVQPKVEGLGIILLFVAMALLPLKPHWAGLALVIVGGLVVVRMWRWQLWHCLQRVDLLLLATGYAWLGVGLLLLGLGLLVKSMWVTAGIHAITVGAMGVLTVTIMARTQMVRRFRDANAFKASHLASLLMNVVALIRVGQALNGLPWTSLYWATAFWSLAMLLLVWVIWRCREQQVAA